MFSDQPVQDEERIFGGRYKDIQVECDPPQKVVLDGEVSWTETFEGPCGSFRAFPPGKT
jgi:diacylglycerol kinase family enzyme